jgi:hypothetical protein
MASQPTGENALSERSESKGVSPSANRTFAHGEPPTRFIRGLTAETRDHQSRHRQSAVRSGAQEPQKDLRSAGHVRGPVAPGLARNVDRCRRRCGRDGFGYFGSAFDRDCNCDSPGMRGFLIGMPIGGPLGGVIAYKLAR